MFMDIFNTNYLNNNPIFYVIKQWIIFLIRIINMENWLNFEVTHILFYVYALVTEVNSFVMSSFPINMSFISYST